jgi:hypothetical protein
MAVTEKGSDLLAFRDDNELAAALQAARVFRWPRTRRSAHEETRRRTAGHSEARDPLDDTDNARDLLDERLIQHGAACAPRRVV